MGVRLRPRRRCSTATRPTTTTTCSTTTLETAIGTEPVLGRHRRRRRRGRLRVPLGGRPQRRRVPAARTRSLPYPGKRPYPNPLFADANVDYDGDSLTLTEEYDLWVYTYSVTQHGDPHACSTLSLLRRHAVLALPHHVSGPTPAGTSRRSAASARTTSTQQFLAWASANGYRTRLPRHGADPFDAPVTWRRQRPATRSRDSNLNGDRRRRRESTTVRLRRQRLTSPTTSATRTPTASRNYDETHGRMRRSYWAGCYRIEKPFHDRVRRHAATSTPTPTATACATAPTTRTTTTSRT